MVWFFWLFFQNSDFWEAAVRPSFYSYFRIFLFFITTISNSGQRAYSKKKTKKRKQMSSRTLERGSELGRLFNSKSSCQAPVCCSASQVAHMIFKPHGCDPTMGRHKYRSPVMVVVVAKCICSNCIPWCLTHGGSFQRKTECRDVASGNNTHSAEPHWALV